LSYLSLDRAPVSTPLKLVGATDRGLAERLAHLGLEPGARLTRLPDEVRLQPARVAGPRGQAVLSANMAGSLLVHLDDGRKLPLLDLAPGEEGHVEGLTVGGRLARAFEVLGLMENDRLRLLRRLPPMEYVVLLEGRRRARLSEGMAAKVWGQVAGRKQQLATAQSGHPFTVLEFLGGPNFAAAMAALGLAVGSSLELETVEPAQSVGQSSPAAVALATAGGLRLYLDQKSARAVLVQPAG